MKLHHYGVLTHDLFRSSQMFEELGFKFGAQIFDANQRVKLSLGLHVQGGTMIELVEPEFESKLSRLLNRNGPGAYHICFESEDGEDARSLAKSLGLTCVVAPVAAPLFGNRLVSFYYSKASGLIEFLHCKTEVSG